ncbi:hypothetical protein [Rugamonas apoptosis]|uniref:Uncharacterized protein n=1 Tax=Rugamonas apoptosis TaxID=2758570 RepID=A0A7W2F8X7_9BURK|nr:hypothetical protein [Rugamonas apoptosis]MBA5687219.1 hypothetical protein [Rugamonas apoptosis]
MDGIHIGTCAPHLPPEPQQAFIGSGIIFDLCDDEQRCSLALLQGIVIADMVCRNLLDGSSLISDRVMAPRQFAHLLANAGRVLVWREAALLPALASLINQIKRRTYSEPSISPRPCTQRTQTSAGRRSMVEFALPIPATSRATIDTMPRTRHWPGDEALAHAPDMLSRQEVPQDLIRVGR